MKAATEIQPLKRVVQKGFSTLADLQRETNERRGRLEDRFDHFLVSAGVEVRRLREDVDGLTRRAGRPEND